MLRPTVMNSYPNGPPRPSPTAATSLVVSRDKELIALVRRSCSPPWSVEARSDWHRAGKLVGSLGVAAVVFDDDVVPQKERSELIANIHVWFPQAVIIYVAGKHNREVECLAREGGVLSYTSKPVEAERLESLLRSLSHRGNTSPSDPTACRTAH